ncbi:UCH-domain-containing protein [Gonapodya prolifera JEL478]|uniref:Ubiquitin carboxyl-terminal hydrolase n=1 Tax=Gonapodya prolifera (strain JEL478) TaxID=1344416 RepID=A0A139AZS7_GONPJ|nr:UCH-domain-containing protein [Gonapodya prolifera JEL478]|eukprot:KXS22063.1 UCH-domain-containing protein [Gonapodya prolifera JEL478]
MLGRASQRTAADKDDEDLPRGATGLVNLGNTCFMNSSVQCMSATWALTAFFLGPNWRADLNRDNPLGMRGEIAEAYAKLVRELWAEAKEAKKAQSTSRTTSSYFGVRPSEFKAVMARFNSTFQGYHQHDSQELLASLLDGLHEDLNRVKKKPYVSLPDDISERSDEEAAAISWDVYKARNDSVVVDLFQGQFKSKVTCTVCDGVSVTFDPFMYIAVPVVETKEETKRVIVVGRISRETLGDEDTWFCPKCKAHQKVRKKMDVWRVPDQVVIHLKRFSNSGMRTYSWARGGDKIDTLVEFPNTEQETSDSPDPNSNPESDDPVFDLYAVSNHFGGMGGGHYTAYAQSPVDGNWYKFDDSSVSLTSEDNVVTSSAYLLFYRRRGAVLDPPFGQFPETLADATETQTQTLTLTSTSDDVMPGLESSYPPPYTSYIGGDSSGWSRFDSLSGSATPGISITPSISMEENLGSSAAADVIFPGSQGDREVRARAALSRVKGKSVVRTASASADDADADTVWKENETGEMLEQDPHRDEEMASM